MLRRGGRASTWLVTALADGGGDAGAGPALAGDRGGDGTAGLALADAVSRGGTSSVATIAADEARGGSSGGLGDAAAIVLATAACGGAARVPWARALKTRTR